MKFLSIDGPIYKFMNSLTMVFLLSMCFWVSCIPVVTMGAGLIAAYDVGMKIVDNEEGYIVRQFFKSLKSNFKQGIQLEIILLIGVYAVFLDFMLFNAIKTNPIILPILGILTICLVLFGTLYAFPQAARYDNQLHLIIRNSIRISIKFFARTIGTIFVVALLVLAFLYNYTTVFMGVLIGPGCIIYVISNTSKGIFKILEQDDKSENLAEEEKNYVEKETVLSTEQYKFPNATDVSDMETDESDENTESE